MAAGEPTGETRHDRETAAIFTIVILEIVWIALLVAGVVYLVRLVR